MLGQPFSIARQFLPAYLLPGLLVQAPDIQFVDAKASTYQIELMEQIFALAPDARTG